MFNTWGDVALGGGGGGEGGGGELLVAGCAWRLSIIIYKLCCWWVALPGGCPGELDEEEEGNAEEGKQGMEEVTCAADRLLELVFNIEICVFVFVCLFYSFVFYLQHGGNLTDILLSFVLVF